jgi:hypothetical protein
MKGLKDDIPGVSYYRTQPKGWVDMKLFQEIVQEKRFVAPDPMGRKRVIYIDNAPSHNSNADLEDIVRRLQFEIRHLEENTTDLCQSADSFAIKKIKQVWTERWNAKKT